MRTRVLGIVLLLAATGALLAQPAKRPITVADMNSLREVSDVDISADGEWVAYGVGFVDTKHDRYDSDIYMTSWDGSRTLRLTSSPAKEHTPRFSPDGRYIAFLSKRTTKPKEDQVWLLPRDGGEAWRLTDLKGGVNDFVFSPDGKRLVVEAEDPDPEELEAAERPCADDSKPEGEPKPTPDKPRAAAPAATSQPATLDADDDADDEDDEPTPKPIVINRYQFKEDETGWLRNLRSHLYLVDIATKKTETLTSGRFDEMLPSWSPDGSRIVFVSKRQDDPDRNDNWDLYLIDARAGAEAKRLTVNDIADGDPSWGGGRPMFSPDGKWIAYLQGGVQKNIYYAGYHLALIAPDGSNPHLVAPKIDRNMTRPRWSQGGATLTFLLEDDGQVSLSRLAAAGSGLTSLGGEGKVYSDFAASKDGRMAAVMSSPDAPAEVFAMEAAGPRPLSKQNDALLATLHLGKTETISYKSKDGTEIHGFMVKPPDYKEGKAYPTILRIHGGPVSQHQAEFDIDWQVFAAQGYVVAAANPRGSSGRGEAFSLAIYADWGNKDGEDVRGAVDHLIARKIADPQRLGVGGWSYGGILTNYVIVQDQRFKAATSGAGISNMLAGYGTDQYIREYEYELGPPWKTTDVWIRLSSPFLHADRITTPTLFLCGDSDWNVPLSNTEQMYQALRSLGRDTELVVYPGESHGLSVPSYEVDRLQRYLDWYAKYLKK
jgi:dipeptidyl aminopeptidase/acylaminoacyl peptidase